MANEITVNGSLAYSDSEGSARTLSIEDFIDDLTTKEYVCHKQTIGASEEAIDLGSLTTCGWALFINRSETTYINLKVATGGAIFAKLNAGGGAALLYLGSGAQAPYAIAGVAGAPLEVFIAAQ